MRIASYNIDSGGFDGFDHKSKSPPRIGLLQKAIKQIDADVIGLPETFRWDEIYSASDIKKLFGYPKVFGVNLQDKRLIDLGENGGVTVLSRLPETTFESIRVETRNMVLSRIGSLVIAFVYFDDANEDMRIKQVNKLLEIVGDSGKVLILGDFNTFKQSEIAITRKRLVVFKRHNPEVYSIYADSISEMLRGEVLDVIEAHGFIDLGEGGGMTYPTKLLPAKTNRPLIRLDYAFGKGNLKYKNFRVHRGKIFDQASDHYPISVEIDNK